MFSVVIPLFNEARRLSDGLAGVEMLEKLLGNSVELILVDDGSTDETLTKARMHAQAKGQVRVLAEPHRGKGGAVKSGVLAATGDRILVTDVDWSVPPREVARLLKQPGEIIVAIREGPHASRLGEPPTRHLIGRAFNRVVQWAVMSGHDDTQCGCKILSREAAQAVFTRMTVDGWAYDVELLVIAHARGFDIQEAPVTWRYQPDTRVRLWSDSVTMVRDVFRIRKRLRDGHYIN